MRSTISQTALILTLITLSVIALASNVPAADKQIRGFGKARFKMSVPEVRKLYPEIETLAKMENLGANPIDAPYADRLISRYVLRDQTVPGLTESTDVELRFWKGKFWLALVYYGDNTDAAVAQALRDKLGPPNAGTEEYPRWETETGTLKEMRELRYYGIDDNHLTGEARDWYLGMLRGTWTPEPEMSLEKETAAPDSGTPAVTATPAAVK